MCTPVSLRHALFLRLTPRRAVEKAQHCSQVWDMGPHAGVMCGEPLLCLTFAFLSTFTHRAVQALRPGLEFLISFRGCFWKYWLVWGGNCHCHGCLELSPRTSGQVFPLGGKGARVGCAPFGLPSAPVAG